MSHEAAGRITTWKLVLFRMYRCRVKIIQNLSGQPTWTYGGWEVGNSTVQALRSRHLIERTRNNGKGKVTWSITDKGRRLAKKMLR